MGASAHAGGWKGEGLEVEVGHMRLGGKGRTRRWTVSASSSVCAAPADGKVGLLWVYCGCTVGVCKGGGDWMRGPRKRGVRVQACKLGRSGQGEVWVVRTGN